MALPYDHHKSIFWDVYSNILALEPFEETRASIFQQLHSTLTFSRMQIFFFISQLHENCKQQLRLKFWISDRKMFTQVVRQALISILQSVGQEFEVPSIQ